MEDRYGMPWSEPAARMREYVGAVRAAFVTFRTGERPGVRKASTTGSRGCSRTSTRGGRGDA
ncbi:hypothetical protein ACU686_32480 [Yinghuangia aomiensis]